MKILFTIIFTSFISTAMNTSTIQSTVAGEYYLQGVMETASGFKLNEDSTFQFFFMYGAMDRMGEGKWSVSGDSIIFNSRKKPSHDYAFVKSERGGSDSIVIRMTDANEMMSHYLYCKINGGGMEQEAAVESDGSVHFSPQPLDSITILFEFAPEKISTFTIAAKDHHYFEFRSEPWIMEIFFENFKLNYGGDHLNGSHPLLNGSSFTYKKPGY